MDNSGLDISSVINGISDHDTQTLTIESVYSATKIIKVFDILPHRPTVLKHEKAKLRAALWKYLSAHFLYPVDEIRGMCKVDVLCCFVKCFIVIYNKRMCIFVYSWFLPHRTVFVTHSWKVNLFVVASTCLNVRIWALWCDKPLIMGDTEDISSSLISTIILSKAVLELFLNLVAKYTAYFRLYYFNIEASCFFPRFLQ